MKLGRLISNLKAIQSSEEYETFSENIQHNIAELLSIIVKPVTEPETLMQDIRGIVTQLNNNSKDIKEKEPALLHPLLKLLSTDDELSELQKDISREAGNFSVHTIDYWRNEIHEIPLDLSKIKNFKNVACIEDETFFKYCSQNNLDELPPKILNFFIQSFHERINEHKKECMENIPKILNQLKKTLDNSQVSAAKKIDDLNYLFEQMTLAESTIELDLYLAKSKKIIYALSAEMPGTDNLKTLLANFNEYGDICSALVGTETERNISVFAKILKKISVLMTHIPGVHEVFAVGAVVSEAGPSPFIHFKPKPPPLPFRERARDFLKKHWKGILLSTLLIAAVAFPYIAPAFLAGAALATAITVSGYVTIGLGAVSVGSVAWSLGSLWKKENSRHHRIEVRLANYEKKFIAFDNQKLHESESEIFSNLHHAGVIKHFENIVNNEILEDKCLTDAQRNKILIEMEKINEKITPECFSQLNINIQNILCNGDNRQVFAEIIQKLQDLDRTFKSQVLSKNITDSPATVQTTHTNEPERPPVNVQEKTAKKKDSSSSETETSHPHR